MHKNDIARLENGEATFVFIEPEGKLQDYVRISRDNLKKTFKVDHNKFEAIFISL